MGEDEKKIVAAIGKKLDVALGDAGRDPLPRRWVELINYLNEQEREGAPPSGSDEQRRRGDTPRDK